MAAGFGLDFETCDPEILAAVIEELEEQAKEARREERAADLRRRVGR